MRCAAPWKYLLRISGGKRRRRVVRPRKTKDGRPIPSNPEMRSHAIAAMLKGGDRRSIGRSNEVKKLVLRQPGRLAELFKCLWNEDPVVRMRAADAAEKITVSRPELLKSCKQELLGLLDEAEQIELRWHLALMVPRLSLSGPERARAAKALQRYLEDRSSIVKTFVLQGLADLAKQDASLRDTGRRTRNECLRAGAAGMEALERDS